MHSFTTAPCQTEGSLQLYSTGVFQILEVCVNGSWGRVCGDDWDNSQTQVVCEQLGYSRYGIAILQIQLKQYEYINLHCMEHM